MWLLILSANNNAVERDRCLCVIFQYLHAFQILFVFTYIFHFFIHKELNGNSQGISFVMFTIGDQVELMSSS